MTVIQRMRSALNFNEDEGVASGWTGWTMSSGPEGPGSPNQNDTIGLGVPHCPLSMGPEGLATPVNEEEREVAPW